MAFGSQNAIKISFKLGCVKNLENNELIEFWPSLDYLSSYAFKNNRLHSQTRIDNYITIVKVAHRY